MRNPGIRAKAIPTRGTFLDPASLCGVTRCDAESRNTRAVIPHLMRNPEIRAKAIPTRGPSLDPASWCGVTRCDAESRKYPLGHSVLTRHTALRRGIQKYPSREYQQAHSRLRPLSGPRHLVIPHCDAVLPVIPHLMRCSTSYRATTRYPGILSAALVLCGPSLDPAS